MKVPVLVVVIVVISLATIGGFVIYSQNPSSPSPTTQLPVQSSDTGTEDKQVATSSSENTQVRGITITGSDFKLEPSVIEAKKGEKIKITFINSGGFHDFVIDELGVRVKRIGAGASESVEFVADKTGTFEYYCSVDTHRQMGMKGQLIVE